MILYEEILREFQKQKVKYIIVGGIAFNLLGGSRNTLDLDMLVEMTDDNLRRVVTILKKAGFHVKQPVDPIMIAIQAIREDWIKNKNMKALNFYKNDRSYQEVDILIDSPVDYRLASKDASKVRAGKLTLPVISVKRLIQMKKATGRDMDRRDVAQLKTIHRIR